MNVTSRIDLKKYYFDLVIIVTSIFIQFVLIFIYQPQTVDYTNTNTISGKYQFEGGTARLRDLSSVNDKPIFCSVSYLGPYDSCSREFKNAEVIVKLARYKHLFGSGEVVVEISSFNGISKTYSANERIKLWWRLSVTEGLLNGMLLGSIVVVGYRVMLSKRK